MQSKTVISISRMPWWPGRLKCLPTSSDNCFLLTEPMWPEKRLWMLSPVWPMYCILQVLHVIQQMRLLLLHVTFFLHSYSLLGYVLVILPDLFNMGQKTHLMLLHLFMCLQQGFLVLVTAFGIFASTNISLCINRVRLQHQLQTQQNHPRYRSWTRHLHIYIYMYIYVVTRQLDLKVIFCVSKSYFHQLVMEVCRQTSDNDAVYFSAGISSYIFIGLAVQRS